MARIIKVKANHIETAYPQYQSWRELRICTLAILEECSFLSLGHKRIQRGDIQLLVKNGYYYIDVKMGKTRACFYEVPEEVKEGTQFTLYGLPRRIKAHG